jgi:hypothetical protein
MAGEVLQDLNDQLGWQRSACLVQGLEATQDQQRHRHVSLHLLLEVKDDECGRETHRHVRTCERYRGVTSEFQIQSMEDIEKREKRERNVETMNIQHLQRKC